MGTIRMNYQQVIAEAQRLEHLAGSGQQYLREMNQIKASIPAVWTGEASDAFINVCSGWERDMNDLVNSLQIISRNLRVIAEEIRQAEERAKAAIRGS